jgi:hypothetical protein
VIDTDALLQNAKPIERYIGFYKWFGWTPDIAPSPIAELLSPLKSKLMGDEGRFYRTESAAMDALRAAVAKYKETQA